MIPELSLQNFLSWAAQVSAIALVGAVLPSIFRIHHPRSHLAWCYALLLASLVLPLIQPWHYPVVSSATPSHPEPADSANVAHSTPAGRPAFPSKRVYCWVQFSSHVAPP